LSTFKVALTAVGAEGTVDNVKDFAVVPALGEVRSPAS
jgi:hypothetical protein